MKIKILLTILITLSAQVNAQDYEPDLAGTYSIIGLDPETAELGIGVQSKSVAVGSRVRGGKGGLAVFAHQAFSHPYYSIVGVELLQAGMSPQQALDILLRGDEDRDRRQVAILDIQGRTAAWTSSEIPEWKGHQCGTDYCVQGNTLTGPNVIEAMARSFESSRGQPLAERLLDALDAAQAAGGDKRGMQSAALMVLKPLAGSGGFDDRVLDLRVDEHKSPLIELRRVLQAFRARELVRQAGGQIKANQLKAAMALADRARDLHPDGDNVWLVTADIHLRMGDREKALSALRRAVELNPVNKSRLPDNKNFTELHDHPGFLILLK